MRWHCVVAGTAGGEGKHVDLLAPGGAATVDGDLAREGAGEAARGAGGGAGAELGGDEGEFGAGAGHVVEESDDVDHGTVVERDGVVVAALEGEDLGPAAVGVLGGEEIVDAPRERGAPRGGAGVGGGGGDRFGEEAELGDRGVVVDGADIAGFVAGAFAGPARGDGEVGVFVPTAGGGLK